MSRISTAQAGLIANPPLWRFIEWAALDKTGISAAMNGLYLLALKAAKSIANALDYGHARDLYAGKVAKQSRHLCKRANLWDKRARPLF